MRPRIEQVLAETPRDEEHADGFPADRDTIGGIDRTPLAVPSAADAIRLPPASPRRPPIGRFQLIERVGAGGFGEVWRAFDPHLQRDVALKLGHVGDGDDRPDLLLHEARAAGRLRHYAIVPVHEAGVEGGVAYIVSDYVPGTTLEQVLKSGPLPHREAAKLARALADALAHAHEQGVIHRDIKPSNVLIDSSGDPHLTDFGIARRVAGDGTISEAGRALGTPAYMSPEQARGETAVVGPRSDVFALGLLLYEMLAGRRVYPGTAAEALRDVLMGPPDLIDSRVRDLPRGLRSIVETATAREPSDRYRSASAMAEDLRRYLDGETVHARPVGLFRRGWRRIRWRTAAAMGVASVLTAVAVPLWPSSRDLGRAGLISSAGPGSSKAPTVVPPPVVRPRSVLVETRPPGAVVHFFRLDPQTGWIDHEGHFSTGRETPCKVDLLPGEYFVVAVDAAGNFNETTRWVPFPEEKAALNHDNLLWVRHGDGIAIAPIPIPPAPTSDSLVEFSGSESYVTAEQTWRPARRLSIPPFAMTATEFTVADLRRAGGPLLLDLLERQPPPDHAALLRYDEAVTALERAGFRLPSEFELEYAARWSEPDWPAMQAEVIGRRAFGPVGTPTADRSGPGRGVLGLRSGPAEWTASCGNPMPWEPAAHESPPFGPMVLFGKNGAAFVDRRVVRGGSDDVQTGSPTIAHASRDPGTRCLVSRFDGVRRIGCHGVRSVRPHLAPSDFLRDLGPAEAGPRD